MSSTSNSSGADPDPGPGAPRAAASVAATTPRFVGVWDRANALTLLGLTLAALSVHFALTGRPALAVVCLLWSGVCDLYDGLLARGVKRDELARTYGSQLDSIVDMAAFGVAPFVLLRQHGMGAAVDLPILVAFVLCAGVRLAYFNTVAIVTPGAGGAGYRGLPVTFAAWIFPLGLLAGRVLEPAAFRMGLRALVLLVAFLFVWGFRMPRLGVPARLVLTAAAVGLTVVYLA